nr:hypothetical protein [Tanacetum cinerariifolium]
MLKQREEKCIEREKAAKLAERLSEIKHAFTDKQYQLEEIQELMSKLLEDVQNINEELSDYTNYLSWNRPIFYDNDEHSREYLEKSSKAITPVLPTKEPEYSLSMGDEHFSTILKMESDELIKSSIDNLVPILSEHEVTSDNESECDVPVNDESSPEEFSGELMPTSIINEERIKREHEEYISFMEKLLTINSFPHSLENFHANTIIETLPTSHIPVEDSDSLSNDSIPLPENESFSFDDHDDHDDPSFPRP